MSVEDVLPYVGHIVTVLKIAKQIHDGVQDVKSFKEKSKNLAKIIELLVQPLRVLEKRCTDEGEEELVVEKYCTRTPGHGHGSGDAACSNVDDKGEPIWKSSLLELQSCMEEIQAFLKKLSNKNLLKKYLWRKAIGANFDSFDNRLGRLSQGLILSLQTEFSSYFTGDMEKQWEAALMSALDSLQKDVKDLKQELKNQGQHIVSAPTESLRDLSVSRPSKSYMEDGEPVPDESSHGNTEYAVGHMAGGPIHQERPTVAPSQPSSSESPAMAPSQPSSSESPAMAPERDPTSDQSSDEVLANESKKSARKRSRSRKKHLKKTKSKGSSIQNEPGPSSTQTNDSAAIQIDTGKFKITVTSAPHTFHLGDTHITNNYYDHDGSKGTEAREGAAGHSSGRQPQKDKPPR